VEDPLSFPDELLAGDEQIARRFRSHPWALVSPIAWMVVISGIAFIYVASAPDSEGAALAIVVLWVAWLIGFLVRVLSWATTIYVVTTERIIWRTGLLSLTTEEIPLAKIDSIRVEVGMLARLFRCGTFVMRSANLQGKIRWPFVPEVNEVHAQLSALIKGDREGVRPPD
jgi:membrane protein YdbS with pleckstrin-like domain